MVFSFVRSDLHFSKHVYSFKKTGLVSMKDLDKIGQNAFPSIEPKKYYGSEMGKHNLDLALMNNLMSKKKTLSQPI